MLCKKHVPSHWFIGNRKVRECYTGQIFYVNQSGFYWIKYLVELAKERPTVNSKQVKRIAIIENLKSGSNIFCSNVESNLQQSVLNSYIPLLNITLITPEN